MNKFWIILFHTYLNKFKTKSFLITTALTIVITLALTNMNNIIEVFDKSGGKEKVAVLDETGQLYDPLKEQMSVLNKDLQLTVFDGSEQEAVDAVEKGEYAGIVLLRFDEKQLPEATYKAMSVADSSLYSDLQTGLQQLKTMLAASHINLTPDQLQQLYEPVSFEKIALEEN